MYVYFALVVLVVPRTKREKKKTLRWGEGREKNKGFLGILYGSEVIIF